MMVNYLISIVLIGRTRRINLVEVVTATQWSTVQTQFCQRPASWSNKIKMRSKCLNQALAMF